MLPILGGLLFFTGLILYIIGSIGLLVEEFRENIIWGIFCFLFPVTHLLFIILYFDRAKKWLGYMIGGFSLAFIGVMMVAPYITR